jgi:hypothetical protein
MRIPMRYPGLAAIIVVTVLLSVAPSSGSLAEKGSPQQNKLELVAARVGGEEIPLYEVGWELKRKEYDAIRKESVKKAKDRALESLVNIQLLNLQGKASGMDRDPEFVDRQRPILVSWLATLYMEEFERKGIIISQEELDAVVPAPSEKFRALMLVAGDEGKAREAKALLSGGRPFVDVFKEYNTDLNVSSKNGRIDWFTSRDHRFLKNNFDLFILPLGKGNVAEPFFDQLGWIVLVCDDRVMLDQEEINIFQEKARKTAIERAKALSIENILKKFPSESFSFDLSRPESPSDRVGEYIVTVGELQRYAAYRTGKTHVSDNSFILSFRGEYIRSVALSQEAAREGFDKRIEIRRRFESYKRNAFAEYFLEQMRVEQKIDPKKVRDYYKERLNEFRKEPEVWVSMAMFASKASAEAVLKRVRKGESLDSVVAEANGGKKLELVGPVSPSSLHGMDTEFLKMKKGEISKPAKIGEQYVIFRVERREESRTISLDEASPGIELKLRDRLFKEKVKNLFQSLRKKHKVEIFADRLKYLEI